MSSAARRGSCRWGWNGEAERFANCIGQHS
jgi:hypothetical protein